MSKPAGEPLKKHTLNLYDGDWDELGVLFPEVETSTLIRETIRNMIKAAKANDPKKEVSGLEIKV